MQARFTAIRSLDATYRTLGWLCLVVGINQLGFGSIVPVVPTFARSFGVSQAAAGLVISVYGLGRLLFDLPMGGLAERMGRRKIIIIGELSTIVCGTAFVCLAGAYTYPVFLLGMFLWGIGGGIGGSAPAAYAADMAPPGANGVTMGIYLTIADAGYVFGPFLLGWFADLAGGGAAMLITAGMFAVAILFFALFAPETMRGRKRQAPLDMPIAAHGDATGGAAAE